MVSLCISPDMTLGCPLISFDVFLALRSLCCVLICVRHSHLFKFSVLELYSRHVANCAGLHNTGNCELV